MEQWRPIVITKNGVTYDYTGLYEVSNLGGIRSLNYRKTGKVKVVKPDKTTDGYLRVVLHKDGESQRFAIHRLVATMFIPNPHGLPVVNHKDKNPSNNNVENLEWCTQKYNVQYSLKGKAHSEETKQKIREKMQGNKNRTGGR